ncbi:MAG: 50S ribosomal protein L11 methyltransferase [Armatimonadetes bacterium]|nr:50S ribosomal protein L11 methyltransferase [Armatimonadota bacterium]MDW8120989.1 50S ribosomal protein L11 methyltransferase [Armatimonadota bacterium]
MERKPDLGILKVEVVTHPADSELIGHLLSSFFNTLTTVVVDDPDQVRVCAFRPALEDGADILRRFQEKCDEMVRLGYLIQSPSVSLTLLDLEEAFWFPSFPPLLIGRTLAIVMDASTPTPPDRIRLTITGAGGFGTGHHPTTRLCLVLMEQSPIASKVILDVGTGSGILSIAAAKWGAATVVATDLDPCALSSARYHAAINQVGNAINFLQSDLAKAVSGSFDLIVSNLSAELVKDLAYQIKEKNLLTETGIWIGSGFTSRQWSEVHRLLTRLGYEVVTTETEDDWQAFQAVWAGNSLKRRKK